MPLEAWAAVALVVLGALLGVVGTVAVEAIKIWNDDRNRRDFLKHVIRDDVAETVAFIGRMIDRAEDSGYWHTPDWEELRLARQRFDRSQDWRFFFKQQALRSQLAEWYRELTATANRGFYLNTRDIANTMRPEVQKQRTDYGTLKTALEGHVVRGKELVELLVKA